MKSKFKARCAKVRKAAAFVWSKLGFEKLTSSTEIERPIASSRDPDPPAAEVRLPFADRFNKITGSVQWHLGRAGQLVERKHPDEWKDYVRLIDTLVEQPREVQRSVAYAINTFELSTMTTEEAHRYFKMAITKLSREDVLRALRKSAPALLKMDLGHSVPNLLVVVAMYLPYELTPLAKQIEQASETQLRIIRGVAIQVVFSDVLGIEREREMSRETLEGRLAFIGRAADVKAFERELKPLIKKSGRYLSNLFM